MGQVEPAEEFGEWDFRVGLGAASRLTFSSRDNHCRIFIKNLLLLEDAADRAHDEEREFTALCTLRDLRLENRCAVTTSGEKTCFDTGKLGFCHCAVVLRTQVPKLGADLDLDPFTF